LAQFAALARRFLSLGINDIKKIALVAGDEGSVCTLVSVVLCRFPEICVETHQVQAERLSK
jgi:hypothetical protein